VESVTTIRIGFFVGIFALMAFWELAAEDFFGDMFETALEHGELITAMRIPLPQAAGYAKVRSPASRYALTGVFVARTGHTTRVAVTGAGPKVFRVAEAEQRLSRDFRPEALDGLQIPAAGLNDDHQGSAAYRAHLIMVCARRAVAEARRAAPTA